MAELEKEQKATESATDKNLVPFEQVQTLGDVIAKSGMFPDVKSAAQAVVKILAGRELGFGPVYSMTKVDVVRGTVRVRAEMMAACIKRSGRYDYKVVELTDEKCVLDFTDRGQAVYRSAFSTKDADKAHLLKGADSAWGMWARAMLFSKALSQGARIVVPHLIAGAYTIEEFGEMETVEGKVVQVVEEPQPKANAPQPAQSLNVIEPPEGHMVVEGSDLEGQAPAPKPTPVSAGDRPATEAQKNAILTLQGKLGDPPHIPEHLSVSGASEVIKRLQERADTKPRRG